MSAGAVPGVVEEDRERVARILLVWLPEAARPGAHSRSDDHGRDRPARAPLLAKAAARALAWTVDVPSSAIKVIVWDGFVTLSGTVDRVEQRNAAERAVRAVPGVVSVFNAITVRYPDMPAIEPWLADSLARAGR